ncbi:MAG: hypothetical protein IPG23_11440 [Burkholderiales bacterium]|nr:hypothetical protein [Burkholderiales bacterium]
MTNSSFTKPEPVVLHDGTSVSPAFYSRVKDAILAGIPMMRPGVRLSLRKICGGPRWRTFDISEVAIAGLCGVTIARRGEVPLDVLNEKDARNARLYQLR